jgi:hypothetical protein
VQKEKAKRVLEELDSSSDDQQTLAIPEASAVVDVGLVNSLATAVNDINHHLKEIRDLGAAQADPGRRWAALSAHHGYECH